MAEETAFRDLTRLFDTLSQTSKRNEKKKLISSFLKGLRQDEIQLATEFLTGQIFPEDDSRVLEIGVRMLQDLIHDDRQLTLAPLPLTLQVISQIFNKIASTRGKGSRAKKRNLLQNLLSRVTPIERKYLVRLLLGEMRIGVVEGVTLEAIAEVSRADIHLVHRANMLLGNIGKVAEVAMTYGEEGLRNVQLKLFQPIKPMLAEIAHSFEDIFAAHEQTSFEYKFDGARVQIHIRYGDVKIYSRRLTDVTESIPEVIELVIKTIQVDEALIDGEVVAYGDMGKPLPFQELMRRFRRVHSVDMMQQKIPLKLFVFDILYLNGKLLIDESYKVRRELLSVICPPELLTPRLVTLEIKEAERFLDEAIRAGHEGIIAKALNSVYSPGIRGQNWFKIKPTKTLDVVITAADWGYGRRSGWLSNYHLAVHDSQTEDLVNIGKTFKGFTDQEFQEMTQRLQQLKLRETPYTVYVRPYIVVEVAFNEIQKSSTYRSGFALRFARITKIRMDKNVEAIDTLDRVRSLFKEQFRYKSNLQIAPK